MGSCLAGKLEGVLGFEVRETRNRDLGAGHGARNRGILYKGGQKERQIHDGSSKGNGGDLEEI